VEQVNLGATPLERELERLIKTVDWGEGKGKKKESDNHERAYRVEPEYQEESISGPKFVHT